MIILHLLNGVSGYDITFLELKRGISVNFLYKTK